MLFLLHLQIFFYAGFVYSLFLFLKMGLNPENFKKTKFVFQLKVVQVTLIFGKKIHNFLKFECRII